MKNIILNEGYQNSAPFFSKGKNDKIFINKKSYIDLSNCAGSLILGHNSFFYKKIIKKYFKNNYSVFSHPNTHALKFSETIKKIFPNFSKIIFCNSGTEAIIKALRICEALSSKKYVASVAGSWHGSVDQLLYYPDKKFLPRPISSGLKATDKKNLIIIPFGDEKLSKKILDKKKNKIKCLIIEPIQASLPGSHSKKYLKFLEKYCKINDIILIFDEIITGVRSDNFSVQNNYSLKPDITIAGKILGGGLPFGIIGISKKIDKFLKEKKLPVFFGGTFSGNSFVTFLGNEILTYLIKNKKKLKELNAKSEFFEKNLNNFFIEKNIDVKIYRYASLLRIVFTRKKIINRIQRDFIENQHSVKIKKFRSYLFRNNIFYSTSGVVFFSIMTSNKSVNNVIKHIKNAIFKYFR
jgi:glutamate-1-semialdehyde 2,1-aminomutase